MNKIGIIYWSGSGNTESMAQAMKSALDEAGVAADLIQVSDFDLNSQGGYDGFLLGCPAMGAEVLEESEFQPVYDELDLSGKAVGLFGSYGWGSGEWMENWEEDVKGKGGNLFEKGLIINETPDDAGLADCAEFAKRFAKA